MVTRNLIVITYGAGWRYDGYQSLHQKTSQIHLVSLGLDKYNAEWCAEQALRHYKEAIGNSKNPFNEACDYAGMMASQRSLTFKCSSPKAKSKPRAKKPQGSTDFGGVNHDRS